MGWELVKDSKCKCWLNLDEIEIYTDGTHKGRKNWENSINKKIGTHYQWMNDEVEEKWFTIKEYENPCLTLVDENNNEFKIDRSQLCKGALGKIFDKCTDKFRYNIGDAVNDLVIINREYRKGKKNQNIKWYQYQCIKCSNVDWVCESNLKNGHGCNVCCNHPRKVIKGVNDIATTNPELIKYFVNQEDAYKYTTGSHEKVLLKCPDCGYQKKMKIRTLYQQGFGCNKCGDGISYPEKFMANVLTQLNIKFKTQLSKTDFEWCQNFRYDFYLPDDNIIIEMHGGQHYKDAFYTYEETHENDMRKCELARLNGFEMNKNYFVVDSRKSTLEWMKENIIKTLGHLFNFSNVDWEKADLECQKSHTILACKLKRENQKLTTKEIVELIKEETGIEYNIDLITRWLNRGTKLGLCYYNGKEEKMEAMKGENNPMYNKHHSKETRAKISETRKDKCKGENHPHATLVDRFDKQDNYVDTKYQFEYVQIFNFNAGHISECCKGKRKTHKGFIFKYHTN